MADIGESAPFTDAATAISQGKRHLLVRDYAMAVTALAQACELLAEKHGDTADELGEPYLLYGRALLGLAREEAGVLGGGVPGSENTDDDEDAEDDEDKDNEQISASGCKEQNEGEEEEEDEAEEEQDELEEEEKADSKSSLSKKSNQKHTTNNGKNRDEKNTKIVEDNVKETEVIKNPDKTSEEKKEETNDTTSKESNSTTSNIIDNSTHGEKSAKAEITEESTSSSKSNNNKITKQSTKQDEREGSSINEITDSNKKSRSNGTVSSSAEHNGSLKKNKQGGTDNAKDEDRDIDENEDEDEDENEDEVNNLQVAWEVLELAKLVLLKRGPTGWKLLADSYRLLGEVAMEGGNHQGALDDLQGCLILLKKIEPHEPRAIAEIHYQLGLAHSLGNDFDASIEQFNEATNLLETRIKELESVNEPPNSTDPFYTIEGEIQELKELLPEIQEKITDMRDFKQEACKLVIEGIKNKVPKESSSSGAGSSNEPSLSTSNDSNVQTSKTQKPATDISHLIRKKRKADEAETDIGSPSKKSTTNDAV